MKKNNESLNIKSSVEALEAKLDNLGYEAKDVKKALEEIKQEQFKKEKDIKSLKQDIWVLFGTIAATYIAFLFIKK